MVSDCNGETAGFRSTNLVTLQGSVGFLTQQEFPRPLHAVLGLVFASNHGSELEIRGAVLAVNNFGLQIMQQLWLDRRFEFSPFVDGRKESIVAQRNVVIRYKRRAMVDVIALEEDESGGDDWVVAWQIVLLDEIDVAVDGLATLDEYQKAIDSVSVLQVARATSDLPLDLRTVRCVTVRMKSASYPLVLQEGIRVSRRKWRFVNATRVALGEQTRRNHGVTGHRQYIVGDKQLGPYPPSWDPSQVLMVSKLPEKSFLSRCIMYALLRKPPSTIQALVLG